MGMGIYKIINVVNNKFYVGSAVNFSRRKARHFSELRHNKHKNRWLQASWNKHGESAFVFALVEEVQDKTLLLEAENRWLKEHVGKDYCYNIGVDATAPMLGMSGEASPTWGYKHTPEAIAIITSASTGRKHTPEDIEKIRQHWIGKPKSAAIRAKISATLSGEGNFWYGKKRPDHGAKVSKTIFAKPDGILFPSILVARRYYDVKPTTLNRALKSNKPISRGKLKGYVFTYGGIGAVPTENDLALIKSRLDSLPNP
jgi:group I intron endonuclease